MVGTGGVKRKGNALDSGSDSDSGSGSDLEKVKSRFCDLPNIINTLKLHYCMLANAVNVQEKEGSPSSEAT